MFIRVSKVNASISTEQSSFGNKLPCGSMGLLHTTASIVCTMHFSSSSANKHKLLSFYPSEVSSRRRKRANHQHFPTLIQCSGDGPGHPLSFLRQPAFHPVPVSVPRLLRGTWKHMEALLGLRTASAKRGPRGDPGLRLSPVPVCRPASPFTELVRTCPHSSRHRRCPLGLLPAPRTAARRLLALWRAHTLLVTAAESLDALPHPHALFDPEPETH